MPKKLAAFIFCLFLIVAKAQELVITNVNIIPIEGGEIILKNQTVFIKNEVIIRIIPFKPEHTKDNSHREVNIIDGTGKYLIPGLADMHVHFPDQRELKLDQFFKLNLAAGVTTLRSMRGEPRHLTLRDSIQKKLIFAPDLYISTALPSDSTTIAADLKKFIGKAKKEKWDFVKYLSGLTPALFDSAALYCRQNKIKLAGHVFNNDLQMALKNSQASVEHYQSVLKEYRRDSTHFDETMKQLKEKNMFICPTLSFYNIWGMQFTTDELKQRNGMDVVPFKLNESWVNDFMKYYKSFDTPEKQAQLEIGIARTKKGMADFARVLKMMNDNKVMILLSPDESAFNVPGYAMVEEMKLYKKAGLGNYDILKICTYNASCFFGAQNEWGSITTGKKANLVLLDKNPLEDIENIKAVYGTVLRGQFYTPAVLLKQ